MPAQGVRAAQQRFGELRRELSGRACLREDVLHHVREIAHRVEPDHRGATLDRVDVTEDRVDRVGIRAAALEREQGVDHAVEPFVGLVAKELDEFGFGVRFDDAHAATASCSEETLDVDDSDEPGVVQSGAREQFRLGLFGDRRERADVRDLVDREAGSKPAVLGDEEALRKAVAPDPEDGREIEDGQDLAAKFRTPRTVLSAPGTGDSVPSSATSITFSTATA